MRDTTVIHTDLGLLDAWTPEKFTNQNTLEMNGTLLYTGINLDAFVKSIRSRHSREGGSPEALEKTGFPPSRE
jgi:hypothetical protein